MKLKLLVHEAEEGGFWAEVPVLPGCASQGETLDELLANMREAIEGCLSVDVPMPPAGSRERVVEIALRGRSRAPPSRVRSRREAGGSCA